MQKAPAISTADRGAVSLGERLRPLLQFRYFALLTIVATYGLMVLGGTVRATDSGTACPDWPLCHGQVIPPMEWQVLIEWAHRLVASFVGLLIIGTVIWGWRRYRDSTLIKRVGVAAVVLLAVQVIVGGITVGTETKATVVAIHLTLALTLLTGLILMASEGYRRDAARGSNEATKQQGSSAASGLVLHPLALATMGALFALMIVGVYVSKNEAGLAYSDWPLFDGKLVSAGGKLADLHYAHRLLAGLVGVFFVGLLIKTLRSERRQAVIWGMTAAFVLFVAQVLIGAANVWMELATAVRVVHLALASALWGVLVFALAWSRMGGDPGAGQSLTSPGSVAGGAD